MALCIFDLDNTLIAGDSDHAWGEFLIDCGLVNASEHRRKNDQFYAHYLNGTLDIDEYLSFSLKPITGMTETEVSVLHTQFLEKKIAPMRLQKADELIASHRAKGDTLLIITATNSVVTHPIAKWLGIEDILASDAEIDDDTYTGKATGTPCYQRGKVERLLEWLADKPYTLESAYFYSDSHNDLPLLEHVSKPIAVDPDPTLHEIAEKKGWPVISLR